MGLAGIATGADMRISRRTFILSTLLSGVPFAFAGGSIWKYLHRFQEKRKFGKQEVCILRAESYEMNLTDSIRRGFEKLAIKTDDVRGKKVLLKPNLVEPHAEASHINTHPSVVAAAATCFLELGAASVVVAEATGHRRDSLLVFEEAGYLEPLRKIGVRMVDLNHDSFVFKPNEGKRCKLKQFAFPHSVLEADWIVSLAKMKTHHWTGATLSMKNLFGIMPGSVYGWPKNVLHHSGIENAVLDICTTINPHFAIIDGIVGMEGDGPIMGEPKKADVLVLGRNLPAVDATAMRIMGIDPLKVPYIRNASSTLGPILEENILQFGEPIADVQAPFRLLPFIPAQSEIGLKEFS